MGLAEKRMVAADKNFNKNGLVNTPRSLRAYPQPFARRPIKAEKLGVSKHQVGNRLHNAYKLEET